MPLEHCAALAVSNKTHYRRPQNQGDKMGQNELMPKLNRDFSRRVLASTEDKLHSVYVRRDDGQGVGL
jgi:hypothetical protein